VTEIPLPGGALSNVVRVGDTVRRATGPWSPFVHALLRHLEGAGFDAVPRFLGIDEAGREILTYVDGEVINAPPLPAYVVADETLLEVGRMLRRLHDATIGFTPPADARWQGFVPGPNRDGVVCHNDAAFYNTVFRDGRPVAWIDWDFATPAPRVWDVAFAAWRWVPLHDDETARVHGWPVAGDRRLRLRLLCDAYELDDERERLLGTVTARMYATADGITQRAAAGEEGFRRLVARGAVDGVRRDIAWLDAHVAELG